MFDKYMIVEDGVKNVVQNGEVTGFQFGARLPYYQGLGVSMIEDLAITVDGDAVPRAAISVTLDGKTYTLDEMESEPHGRWEFGEIGTVTVQHPGGLAPGDHTITMVAYLRISYLPFILTGEDSKTLTLEGTS